MTVELERTIEIDAPRDAVWAFIADPIERARAISVVEAVDADPEHVDRATWEISLPIPLLDKRVSVDTRDVERDPPAFVRFVGRSSVMDIQGEHRLTETETGTSLSNRFVVDGHAPGVETFFERQFGAELDNLEAAFESFDTQDR
ncbi:SRPBCC family protein [Halococcoides cellulosivorans]|uniref:Polyketide cyclase n=1 Tax=Halococcoides cellulosivorans TaxID=1679096 RepID=A0A2R4WYS5_9EURY|nr:SRPBCC family protein [Halococcoides cellulosivorans]AWB26674.1 polyketide cyclase [Halococcoides cellulosivorans]